ncbi:MAG: hypothetical protein ABIP78_01180 [Pyrinomonadaceae bacterium]
MNSKRKLTLAIIVIAVVASAAAAQTAAKQEYVDPNESFYNLTKAAPAAFKAGDMAAATSLANALLTDAAKFEKDWNYGNAIHVGHLVLGRVAFSAGNLKEANRQLLEAGQTPGSPQLNTFGPDMRLARELLEKGETETVLQYFEQCSKFWEQKLSKADEWKAQIRKGEIPDFGPNLVYFFNP